MGRSCLGRWLLPAVLLLVGQSPGWGQTVTSSPDRLPQRQVFLDRAEEFEKRQLWQQAADLYQRALRVFPNDSDLRDRWRSAERLYSLSRRYHDISFQNELLELPEAKALSLYREVVTKIQTHYVAEAPLKELVLSGYRTLLFSLDRPVFVAANFPDQASDRIATLRSRLQAAQDRLSAVPSTNEAVGELRNVVRLCTVHGCTHHAAPIMEFLSGACESLDPYTTHLSPHRLDELYSMIDGNFVGLGVEVKGEDGGLRIVEVLPESPAAEAGLNDGDLILSVDGRPLAGMQAEEAANQLQGPMGSAMNVSVRSVDGKAFSRQIVRREVIVHSIRDARILPGADKVGYVRIESFQKTTQDELKTTLSRLESLGMRGLIIDLRGNPGGLLDVSLEVANLFIGEGVLVSTKGRAWGQEWSHRARPLPTRHYPLSVLVDSESASASEIFASAIQDHRRGTIVGTRTYGKGSVQSIFPLATVRTGLRLTTAHFFSPHGRPLQGVGVAPDVVVTRGIDAVGAELAVDKHPDPVNDAQLHAAVEQISSPLATRVR
ncbi:PDZ domain-containing protein [bacterium]|nr:PDZ domain-containing protein [bacterium]